MPVDDGFGADLVLQVDQKAFAGRQDETLPSILGADAENIGRFAQNVDDTTLGNQCAGRWLLRQCETRQGNAAGKGKGGAKKGATGKRQAQGIAPELRERDWSRDRQRASDMDGGPEQRRVPGRRPMGHPEWRNEVM